MNLMQELNETPNDFHSFQYLAYWDDVSSLLSNIITHYLKKKKKKKKKKNTILRSSSIWLRHIFRPVMDMDTYYCLPVIMKLHLQVL